MGSILFKDLRGFIEKAREMGQLKAVDGADWDKELAALTELMAERRGPALLFDNIKGYPKGYRVLGNAFGSLKNTALVLGAPPDMKPIDMLDAWRKNIRDFRPLPPMEVTDGPVKENLLTGRDVDLFKFPAPVWHERDNGPYLGTGTACITRDPDEGWVNLGTIRCKAVARDLMTATIARGHHARIMVEKYHARGQSCPVAICMGQDPVLYLAARMSLTGWGTSEYDFAGWARNEPVEVIRGETTGLPLPAAAEIVVEGEVPAPSGPGIELDGPFGEWAGHYSMTPAFRVVVKAILHRNDPIILGAPPFQPPTAWFFSAPLNAGLIWNALEAAGIPGVTGVWHCPEIYNPMWLVVRVRQEYAGHAKQAALAATACRQGCYGGKFVVVVDDDVDITDPEEVMLAMASRTNVNNADIVHGTWTAPSDYASVTPEAKAQGLVVSSKLIVDSCYPFNQRKQFTETSRFSPAYRETVLDKYSGIISEPG